MNFGRQEDSGISDSKTGVEPFFTPANAQEKNRWPDNNSSGCYSDAHSGGKVSGNGINSFRNIIATTQNLALDIKFAISFSIKMPKGRCCDLAKLRDFRMIMVEC